MPRASRRQVIGKRSPLVIAAGVIVSSACGQSQPSLPSIHFVGNASCSTTGQQPYFAPSPAAVNSRPPVGEAIDEMPHNHVAPPARVTYNHDPPTSGCHYSLSGQAPVTRGVYTQQISAEHWVHNLEHGYIVVLYNCPSGCDADFQQLRQWYDKEQSKPDTGLVQYAQANPSANFKPYAKIVVLPWPSMQPRFAAVSWDYYDPMTKLDVNELNRFYDNHFGHAPEGPTTP